MLYRLPFFCLAALCLMSCDPSFHEDAWTTKVKQKIIADSDLPTDSAFTVDDPTMGISKTQYFSKGVLTKEKWQHSNGYQSVEILYGSNPAFQLRRELCKDGTVGFEGVFYNNDAYGLSTWWNCEDHTIAEQGIRYKNKHIGFWKTRDDTGKPSKVNFKKFNFLDSLEQIRP